MIIPLIICLSFVLFITIKWECLICKWYCQSYFTSCNFSIAYMGVLCYLALAILYSLMLAFLQISKTKKTWMAVYACYCTCSILQCNTRILQGLQDVLSINKLLHLESFIVEYLHFCKFPKQRKREWPYMRANCTYSAVLILQCNTRILQVCRTRRKNGRGGMGNTGNIRRICYWSACFSTFVKNSTNNKKTTLYDYSRCITTTSVMIFLKFNI